MKTIVIYNSKSGFTKQYAQWIAEELGCDIRPYKDFPDVLAGYDTVIFGSRIHAGRIEKINKVKAYFKAHPKKELIVFATGAAPAAVEDAIEKIWTDNFTEDERSAIPRFYMQSGLNYDKMGTLDRTLMKMFAKMMRNQKDKTEEDKGFADAIQGSYDHSSKEYIRPLVDYIKTRDNAK